MWLFPRSLGRVSRQNQVVEPQVTRPDELGVLKNLRAPYKHPAGYTFPYGDYLSLSVDGDGANHVIWGEGASYDGPGGSWYTRSVGSRR